MISEKQSKYISIISIILAVAFVVTSVFWTESKSTVAISNTDIEEVLNKEAITEVNVDIKESDWKWLLENATDEEYRSGNITINGETFYNVGIRPKGNSSLTQVASNNDSDRYSLKIDFGKYVDGQTYHGIEKLALNNMMSDATYMKEYLSYDIYDYLGVATPEYSYTNIKINGEEWGLYLAVEVVDERFVEKHYGEVSGNLYKPETMEVGMDKANGGGMPMGNMSNNNVPQNNQKPNLNGNMPEGMPSFGGGNGEKPEGMPNFGGGNGEIPQVPNKDGIAGASKSQDDINSKQNENSASQQGKPNMGGFMPGGSGNNGGADLKYIDENIESYSTIRESAVFKSTTDKDFEKVVEMIKNLNDGTNIEDYINVEEVLKYFAVNTFLVNLDSYSGGMYHNYYLYEKDGVFEIIPWDLNMSFAGFSMSDGSKAVNFPIDSPVTRSLEDAPLIGKLLEVDEYKEIYHSYLDKLVNEYFNSGLFKNTVTKLDNLIDDYVKQDTTAFYTYEEYKNSITQLLTFGNDRTASVKAQLTGEQPSTEYGTVDTTVELSSLGGQGVGKMFGGKGENNEMAQGQNGGMPSQENMAEIMKIINSSNNGEFTVEQKAKLSELGVDENMLSMFQNRNAQDGIPKVNAAMGSINKGVVVSNQVISQICVVIVVLILGIMFVFKYKRKKAL